MSSASCLLILFNKLHNAESYESAFKAMQCMLKSSGTRVPAKAITMGPR